MFLVANLGFLELFSMIRMRRAFTSFTLARKPHDSLVLRFACIRLDWILIWWKTYLWHSHLSYQYCFATFCSHTKFVGPTLGYLELDSFVLLKLFICKSWTQIFILNASIYSYGKTLVSTVCNVPCPFIQWKVTKTFIHWQIYFGLWYVSPSDT